MENSATSETERRPVIDLIRGAALLMVVTGHLVLAVIDKPGGEIRGTNLLTLFPRWSWATIIAPMPLFFLAGGYANATSSFAIATRRLATLASLAAVVVTVWAVPVVVLDLWTGESGVIGDGARLATQPLWFFAAYGPLVGLSRALWSLSSRTLMWVVMMCASIVAACDVIRLGTDGPSWVGWIGFLPTYGVFWLTGMWWRKWSADTTANERRLGVVLVVVAGGVATLLTSRFGYSWALIDVVAEQRSNTNPPTIFTVTAGLLQIGLVFTAAAILDQVAVRRARFITRLRDVSVGIYIWHLSALALVSGVIAAALPLAPRFTAGWWIARPLWYGAIGGVTLALVSVTERLLRRLTFDQIGRPLAKRELILRSVGVVLFAGAAAHIGLRGPRTATAAIGLVVVLWLSSRLLSRQR